MRVRGDRFARACWPGVKNIGHLNVERGAQGAGLCGRVRVCVSVRSVSCAAVEGAARSFVKGKVVGVSVFQCVGSYIGVDVQAAV